MRAPSRQIYMKKMKKTEVKMNMRQIKYLIYSERDLIFCFFLPFISRQSKLISALRVNGFALILSCLEVENVCLEKMQIEKDKHAINYC